MKRSLLVLYLLFGCIAAAFAQNNQTVNNGQPTTAVSFSDCNYTWTNDQPGIGLAASGSGNISSFNAVNNSGTAVTATITATAIPVENAYIPAGNPGKVNVINTVTHLVTATIPVGTGPGNESVTPDGSKVYVSNSLSNTVSVINTLTNTVEATVPVGNFPNGISVSYDGSEVFVSNVNDNTISVISTATNSVTATIPGFNKPFALTASTTANLLYVTSQTNVITVVNTATHKIIKNVTVGDSPWEIAVSPDGSRIYVTNLTDNTVSVVNAATNTVIATIPVGLTPEGVAVSPDGTTLYVGIFNAGEVTVINTSTNSIIKQIPAIEPQGLQVSPDGKTLFIVNNTSAGSLTAVDIATGSVIAATSTNGTPNGFGNFLGQVSCAPVKFTITVNPSPAATPDITATAATGNNTACQGTASVSPNIQQVAVSGTNLTGPVTLTAPNNFEISLSATSGFGSTVAITPVGGAINSVALYVRLAATAPAGSLSGNVEGTSPGAKTIEIPVTGTVNALPLIGAVPNQAFVNGAATTAINFTGTGNTFTWTNDKPGIGLAASGTGNINSFNAVNTGSTPVTATITVTPSNPGFAYIPSSDSKSIDVINTTSNSVVSSIYFYSIDVQGIAINADGTRLYVSDADGNAVSVFNTVTASLVTTIAVGSFPQGITISPDGKTIYVANANSSDISVINASTNTVTATIPLSVPAEYMAISPDGTILYTNGGQVINTATNTVSGSIPFSAGGIVISPDGKFLYEADIGTNSLLVISTSTGQVVTSVPVAGNPYPVAISPDGASVYVASQALNTVSVVNTATNKVVNTINVGNEPDALSLTPDGTQLYVTDYQDNTVYVIATATGKVKKTIGVNSLPGAIGNFVTAGGCPGQPVTFTITVDPTPATPPATTGQPATGSIFACAGTPSASPQIEQFPVFGNNLTGNITATAPAGFEVSLNRASGYASSLTLVQSGGSVNAEIYVRSSASAPPGYISGNVVLSSPGAADLDIAVNGSIGAVPIVDPIPDQPAVISGTNTASIHFNGTGNTYTWVNNTPSIGLAASGSGDISPFTAVNTGTTPVTATITVTPLNAGFAYIANYNDNTVSIINTSTNTVVGTLNVGSNPISVLVSPDGTKVYVACQGTSDAIYVFDATTNSPLTEGPLGTAPNTFAITPDGSTFYMVNQSSNTVSVMNVSSFDVTKAIILVGLGAFGVAISPDGSKVYVANQTSNSVSVISTATNTVVATIPVPNGPRCVVVSPDGKSVYVTNSAGGTYTVINAATNTVTATIPIGASPSGIAMSQDGKTLYIANNGSGTVSVVNTANNTVVATVIVGSGPSAIALTPGSSYAYVTNSNSNNVSVISTATNQVVATVPVGNMPLSFGSFIDPDGGCPGAPITFTMTVNPAPAQNSGIIVSPAAGSMSACQGTAASSPGIQHFTVSGTGLSAPVVMSAPNNFEISLSPGGPWQTNITLPITGNSLKNTLVYARLASTAPTGNVSGNVSITSQGVQPQKEPVIGEVFAVPAVNPVAPQRVKSGTAVPAINFSGTGTLYNWTNSAPSIGLPAMGVGSIPSFTAVNNSQNPVMANISVTPVSAGFAYIANYGSKSVSVINTATNTVAATVPVGDSPWGVAVAPAGNYIYVSNQQSNTVSVIDGSNNTVISTINVGSSPEGIVISPDGSTLYVSNLESGNVSVISTATNSVIQTINVGSNPQGIAINPAGTNVYVTNSVSNSVSVINTATNTVAATIQVGKGPNAIAVSPDGSAVYVANLQGNTVSAINAANNTVINTYTVGADPDGICVNPNGTTVYVANGNSASISVINTSTGATSTWSGFSTPDGIGLSDDGAFLYVNNFSGNNIGIVNTSTGVTVATVPVGLFPGSEGNFIWQGSGCSGVPATFTITVNPTNQAPASIVASGVTGFISACFGTASVSPQLEQFTVSGSNLNGPITATVSSGFEISLSNNSNFTTVLTIPQTNGTVNNTIIYVRSSALALAGNLTGDVALSSLGAGNFNVSVNGVVNALPVVNQPQPQTVPNGTPTSQVNFTGTGNVFTWTNDNPSIGLPASGTGNIAPFTAINTGTNPVTATVTVTPQSVAFAYVANAISNNVSVIAIATGEVSTTVPVGNYPCAVSVSPDGTKVYVANQRSNNISVISTATNTVTGIINAGSNSPTALVVSPDGSRLYVVGLNSNNVSVYSTSTFAQITSFSVGGYPVAIAVTPDGSKVYVSNSSNSVSVYNTINRTTNNISAGDSPYGLVVSPDGSKVYAAISGDNNVLVINTATNAIIATIPVGESPAGITITPTGSAVYVANQGTNNVSVINTATNKVIATVTVDINPVGMSVTSDGSQVYVANERSGTVSIINTESNVAYHLLNVGAYPISLGNFISAGTSCEGIPTTFTIKVTPNLTPVISASGQLAPLSTTYGTPSDAESFTVSGQSLTKGITVTAPAGFELSTNKFNFSPSLTVGGGGNIPSQTVYIRLAAVTPVGNYTGNITLVSIGAPNFNFLMPNSVVNPALLAIVADDKSKYYGSVNPPLTITYIGFVNFESAVDLITQPTISTTATTNSPVGQYPITVTGAISVNYSISFVQGTLKVLPTQASFIIPNTFTPNGDGINDTWDIKNLSYYVDCSVNIFTRWGQKIYSSVGYAIPWDGTYKGALLPTGTYYYVIDLKNGMTPLSGFVAIIH